MIYEPSLQRTEIVNSNGTMITDSQTGRRYFRTNFDVSDEISYDNYFTFTTSSTLCDNTQTDPVEPNINLPILGCDIVLHIKNRVLGQPNLTHPNGLPIGYNGKLFIQPGQYTLEIEIKSNNLDISNAYIEVVAQWKENKYPGKKFIGGLRIKEIKDYKSGYILNQTDPNAPAYELDENATITRKYVYQNNDNSPSGWVVGVPVFRSFSKSEGSLDNPPQLSEVISSSSSNNAISSDANNLGYFCVREVRQVEDKEIIKEESFTGDTATSSYPGSPIYHNWTSGRPTLQRLFIKKSPGDITDLSLDGLFNVIQSTQTNYYSVATLPSNYPKTTRGLNLHQSYFSESQADLNEKEIYDIISGTNLGVREQIETDYFYESGSVSTIQNVTKTLYHNLSENGTPIGTPHHFLPLKKINILNNGSETIETKYYYTHDLIGNSLFNQTVINQLNTNHQFNSPLLRETFLNGVKTATLATQFKDWGNNALGQKVLMPEIIQANKGSLSPLENRVRYINIDPLGAKPREMQQENGTSVVYIWGYAKSLPVAKIENISFSSIPSNLINAVQSASTETGLITALNALRNSSALVNAQISTYTYIPLVGVKTMTDPKGYTMTYHYDEFNRLNKVTDMEGNILSENEYHYRTQN
ncbi:RHS repeat protein [Flavobacterium piscinae]|nr:RHS repeat domain-containing protein [Flavobacterium piscinae]MBC8883729.1 RHS repeat protein [Flavobacterium piscinae]